MIVRNDEESTAREDGWHANEKRYEIRYRGLTGNGKPHTRRSYTSASKMRTTDNISRMGRGTHPDDILERTAHQEDG